MEPTSTSLATGVILGSVGVGRGVQRRPSATRARGPEPRYRPEARRARPPRPLSYTRGPCRMRSTPPSPLHLLPPGEGAPKGRMSDCVESQARRRRRPAGIPRLAGSGGSRWRSPAACGRPPSGSPSPSCPRPPAGRGTPAAPGCAAPPTAPPGTAPRRTAGRPPRDVPRPAPPCRCRRSNGARPDQGRRLPAVSAPSSGRAASSVRLATGPIPGMLRSSSSFSRHAGLALTASASSPVGRPTLLPPARPGAPPGRARTAARRQAPRRLRSMRRISSSCRRRASSASRAAGRSSGSGRGSGRIASAKWARTAASMRSVLASRPVALAKSRAWRGLIDGDRQAGDGQGGDGGSLQAAGGLQRRPGPGPAAASRATRAAMPARGRWRRGKAGPSGRRRRRGGPWRRRCRRRSGWWSMGCHSGWSGRSRRVPSLLCGLAARRLFGLVAGWEFETATPYGRS